MNQSTKNILLWICVLPGAVIGAFLATFPLHWVLYGTLVSGSVVSGMDIKPIERFLSPFVITLVFILIGSYIAPNYKFKTAVILTALYFISFTSLFLFMSEQAHFELRGVGALVGTLLGLFVAWKKYSKTHIPKTN